MSQPAESIPTSERVFRVAIYARFSSEMQNEISIEDQVQRCREEIARRGWRVAGLFTDSARSGWSLDRDGFQELRAAAESQITTNEEKRTLSPRPAQRAQVLKVSRRLQIPEIISCQANMLPTQR